MSVIGLVFVIADALDRLHVVELAILFAAIGYVTQLVLDLTGKSRSSRMLRQENEDLVRRNKELDLEVNTLRHEVARLEGELRGLRAQVDDLTKRDQKAVLEALRLHEERADKRWEGTLVVLTEIRDAIINGGRE